MIAGTSARSSQGVAGTVSPRLTDTGSFAMLSTATNQAAVPRSALTGKRAARRCIDITDPPAFATIVVNPLKEL